MRNVAGRDALDDSLDVSSGGGRLAPEALVGVVATALAEALRLAAEAERWEIVAQLAEDPGVSASQYSVLLEPDADGGYVAVVPALPGCYSQGETVEEALANAHEAIALTVEDLSAHGEPVPAPLST